MWSKRVDKKSCQSHEIMSPIQGPATRSFLDDFIFSRWWKGVLVKLEMEKDIFLSNCQTGSPPVFERWRDLEPSTTLDTGQRRKTRSFLFQGHSPSGRKIGSPGFDWETDQREPMKTEMHPWFQILSWKIMNKYVKYYSASAISLILKVSLLFRVVKHPTSTLTKYSSNINLCRGQRRKIKAT